MDLISKQMERIAVGSITTQWGVVIYRASKVRWIVGRDSISIKSDGCDFDTAVKTVYELAKSY